MTIHKGRCFCGAVEVEAEGEPRSMGYCHCNSCREWSAAPVTSFMLWKAGQVRVTKGAEHLAEYARTAVSHRTYCSLCGGHVMNDHPSWGLRDVYPAILPTVEFKPRSHVYYGESVLHIHDGLPKFRDLPEKAGGSGEMMDE